LSIALKNITDDLNYVKSEILLELDKEFNMTEEEAYGLVKVDDSVDYSEYIYSLLGEYEEPSVGRELISSSL